MPLGTGLTVEKMSVIDMLNSEESKSMRAIERKIGKSDRVVQNYLKDTYNYGSRHVDDRKRKLSKRQSRLVILEASFGEK